jgi:hypothetical protein
MWSLAPSGTLESIFRKLFSKGVELFARSRRIRTNPIRLGPTIKAFSYNFENETVLTQILTDADTLYNTYWIHGQ